MSRFNAVVPVAIDIDALEKENKSHASLILYGKFNLDSSEFVVKVDVHANENYEHGPCAVVKIKPTFVDETKMYVEIPVSQLTAGASKIFILRNNVLLQGSHTLAISNTQFVDILRVSPLVWSVKDP